MRRPDNATLIRYAGLAAQTVVGLMAVAIATILIGPRIAGWDVVTVLSGSMAPTYPVDSVLAIEAIDPTKIEEGDVIAFKPEADQTMVSHRVVAVHETPSGDLSFTTKGDANEDPDRDPVLAKDVHGRVVFGVPVMGRLIRMAHTPLGFFLMLVVPAMFVILHEARSIRRTLREEREGKQAPGTEPVQPEQQPAMAAASPAVTIDLTEASDAPAAVTVDPIVTSAPPVPGPTYTTILPTDPTAPSRQLVLVTVAANWANRRDIIDLATLAGGTLVAVGHSSVAFSMTAEPAAVTSFERLLTRFGILSVERSHVLTVSLADDEPAAEEPSDESADDTTEFEQIISAGMDAAGSGTPGATTP